MLNWKILTIAALAAVAGDAAAQDAPSLPNGKNELLKLAERYGRAAGAAEYCGIDPAEVETFIVRALARLAKETGNSVALAGARMEFNTYLAYGRAQGPQIGCDRFTEAFPVLMDALE